MKNEDCPSEEEIIQFNEELIKLKDDIYKIILHFNLTSPLTSKHSFSALHIVLSEALGILIADAAQEFVPLNLEDERLNSKDLTKIQKYLIRQSFAMIKEQIKRKREEKENVEIEEWEQKLGLKADEKKA